MKYIKEIAKELGFAIIGTSLLALPLGLYLRTVEPPQAPITTERYFFQNEEQKFGYYDAHITIKKQFDEKIEQQTYYHEPQEMNSINRIFPTLPNQETYFGLEDRLP
ncbi:MAG: hypothetical protein U9Q99_01575 [Nanoarchaeota archaeon]|nr:hypothetical protein [Nanoarchaeota archaeon]